MKSKRTAISRGVPLVLAALLAGCGGGGTATDSALQHEAALGLKAAAPVDDDVDAASIDEVETDAPAPWELADDPAARDAFLASSLAAAPAATPRAGERVKWNPGHYIAVPRPSDSVVKRTLRDIKGLPHVKGLLIRYDWSRLEPRKGDYDFSEIDRDLALVNAASKRLFIMVSTKSFKDENAVPEYLRSSQYDGGAYRILIEGRSTTGSSDAYGENVALYNANVRDRLIELTKSLGRRYNLHNVVEGVTFNETSLGNTVTPLNESRRTEYFNNLAKVNSAASQAFPNTVVMQFVNFPRPYMPGLVAKMKAEGVALGGPDIFLEDEDLNEHVYPFYSEVGNLVPRGPSVQPENYLARRFRGPLDPQPPMVMFNFARERLRANYLFWTRSNIPPVMGYKDALKVFDSPAFPKDSAGGLDRTCPSSFGICVSKL